MAANAVGQKAAERYLPQFREYVKSLKFKTSMHDAIGGRSSKGTTPALPATKEKGRKPFRPGKP
jgi:hypothetical protein